LFTLQRIRRERQSGGLGGGGDDIDIPVVNRIALELNLGGRQRQLFHLALEIDAMPITPIHAMRGREEVKMVGGEMMRKGGDL
jgi:hypothetical protein